MLLHKEACKKFLQLRRKRISKFNLVIFKEDPKLLQTKRLH